jgi:hypothetical protein
MALRLPLPLLKSDAAPAKGNGTTLTLGEDIDENEICIIIVTRSPQDVHTMAGADLNLQQGYASRYSGNSCVM